MGNLYHSDGLRVMKRSVETLNDDGSKSFTLSFTVCDANECVGTEGAETIAKALNAVNDLQALNADLLEALEAAKNNAIAATSDFSEGYDAAVIGHLSDIEALCGAAIAKAKAGKE